MTQRCIGAEFRCAGLERNDRQTFTQSRKCHIRKRVDVVETLYVQADGGYARVLAQCLDIVVKAQVGLVADCDDVSKRQAPVLHGNADTDIRSMVGDDDTIVVEKGPILADLLNVGERDSGPDGSRIERVASEDIGPDGR